MVKFMRVTRQSINIIRQALRCLVYIGLGHITFEIVATLQTTEYSHLWYYAFLVPGLFYLIPIVALLVIIMIFERMVQH